MTTVPLALPSGSSPARHGHAGATKLVNCYREDLGDEAKSGFLIAACDGFDEFGEADEAGECHVMLPLNETTLYAKIGRQIVKVDAGGNFTTLGGMATDGLCTMARNRAAVPQVSVVSDGVVYKIENDVLTQVSDPDLPPVISVVQCAGYHVYQLADGRMFSSELDNFNVLPTDFAAANSDPDGARRNYVRGQDLISFGYRSMEFWADQGNDTFPFGLTTSRSVGLLSAKAVATVDQTVAFVAHDGTVRILSGYDPIRICTDEIARLISSEDDPQVISCTSWQARGHTWLVVSGSNWSRCYDLATKRWHDRKSYGLERWRISQAVQFGNKIVLGDYANGKLYTLNPDTYTEAGAHLVMTMQFPTAHGFPHRFAHHGLHLDMVPGVGLVSADQSLANPQVMMDYSDDGGEHWSSQRMASIGRGGDRLRRVQFNRLGQSRGRIYRLSVSAAVARSLVGVSLDMEKLAV